MALPTSGLISANNIRTELGIPSQAPFSITSAATGGYVTINQSSPSKPNSTTPHAISEWYGYNHSIVTNGTISVRGYQSDGDSFSNLMTVYKNGIEYLNTSCYSNTYATCLTTSDVISTGDSFYLNVQATDYGGDSYFSVVRVYYNSDIRGTLYDSGNNYTILSLSENFPEFTVIEGENISISVEMVS